MSVATAPGKLKFGAEPKKLALLGLFLVIALVLWIRAYTGSGDVPVPPTVSTTEAAVAPKTLPIAEPPPAGQSQARNRRRFQSGNERGALQMRPVDPTHGDVDPTLRLDLLDRLGNVKMVGAGRSLFAMGTQPITAAEAAKIKGPIIPVGPKPPPAQPPVSQGPPSPAPITLKFYGFIRPVTPGAPRRGFFLDGDVILVATEGEILKQHYRIVSLKENRATFEDTTTKTQQDLALTPEAHEN
ncbi:MAG: hypothetical protein WBW33_27995 [Bryobacteraceae bacterium]